MLDAFERHDPPLPDAGPGLGILGKEEDTEKDNVYSRANPSRPGFMKADQKHMYRMGKVQELKGLANGGLAGLFWSYIWTFIGFCFVEMSLAEMASMAPQADRVSEFAPPSCLLFLSYIPRIDNGLMLVHMLAFFAVIVTLWVMALHNTPKAVFTEFYKARMAEEVRDAGRYVPVSLFWSYIGNGLMTIAFLITHLFTIDNVEAAIDDPSGYPFLYVFESAVSLAGVHGLTIIVLLIASAANVKFGLPFSNWIAKVDHGKEIPLNAILLSCAIAVLLVLINIGSMTALNAIILLQVVSLMFTYACSLSCVLYRRGPLTNAIGFWPSSPEITADELNWSIVIVGACRDICDIPIPRVTSAEIGILLLLSTS
ncbi:hypothetical protein BDV96DRAFT_621122 [Lophiotrema nucula]|uniref:Amino acid permease-domain-containing protein n=1 Tax=Lophiotrema nucula TaxID=690887 RepID=A0A6A5ZA02_9PLEO|nr:hypothetical protein BDV96DRAFT_621122 [Lophiotrema nucula]